MIAKVASFANYGDDLMSICLAVGRKDSKVVRHVCLRNNLSYLRRVLERTIARKRDGGRYRFHLENGRIEKWIVVNSDWRKYCTKERTINAEYCKASFRDERTKEVMYCSDPLIIFNNPAVAIEFDAIDILKFLVESVGIDINAYVWTGMGGAESDCEFEHLLSVADTRATMEYLLSRNELNVFSPVEKDDGETLVWHLLLVYVTCDIFKSLVQHESFNVNGLNEAGFPNLLIAIILCVLGGDGPAFGPLMLRLGNIQCMLDAGADPEQEFAVLPTSTPLQYARSKLRNEAEGSTEANGWQRVIQMMEEVLAARYGTAGT